MVADHVFLPLKSRRRSGRRQNPPASLHNVTAILKFRDRRHIGDGGASAQPQGHELAAVRDEVAGGAIAAWRPSGWLTVSERAEDQSAAGLASNLEPNPIGGMLVDRECVILRLENGRAHIERLARAKFRIFYLKSSLDRRGQLFRASR